MTLVSIDPRDATPIYAQLERGLRAAIATGRLHPGDQLPTVRQLAVDLQINANTVGRVYAELERAGVIETKRGVGSFISATPRQAHPPREHDRRLSAFAMRVLADADRAGVDIDEVIAALRAHRPADGPRENESSSAAARASGGAAPRASGSASGPREDSESSSAAARASGGGAPRAFNKGEK